MGKFKLGKKAKPIGERTMSFKKSDNVFEKNLNGFQGEYDVSEDKIYVDRKLSSQDKRITATHENQHRTQAKIGTETHDDKNVYYNGEVWPIGNGFITNPHTGEKLAFGDKRLPWENNKI